MQNKLYATLAVIAIAMILVWTDGDLQSIGEGLTRLAQR